MSPLGRDASGRHRTSPARGRTVQRSGRLRAACLTLLLALPARGQVLDVERATVTQPDGGVVLVVGGCHLTDERCVAVAQELVQLRQEVATLRAAPPTTPPGYVAALVVGALLGAGAVIAVALAVR